MDSVLLLFLCVFAVVGFVQVLGWVSGKFFQPGRRSCYHVVPLSADKEEVEAQLRHCLFCRRWGGGEAVIVLPAQEMDQEVRQICENLIREQPGVFLCYPWELEKTVR